MMRLALLPILAMPLGACSGYEMSQFAAVAVPVATYTALTGYTVDSAFSEFDNAGGGSSSSGTGRQTQNLRPDSYTLSVPSCGGNRASSGYGTPVCQ